MRNPQSALNLETLLVSLRSPSGSDTGTSVMTHSHKENTHGSLLVIETFFYFFIIEPMSAAVKTHWEIRSDTLKWAVHFLFCHC